MLTLTPSALSAVEKFIKGSDTPVAGLRISISGGGCSGFQYGFSFDDARQPEDVTFERDGIELVIDEVSLELVRGAEIDFVEDMMGASFQVKNPQAVSSCGCGSSFSIG